MEAVREEVGMDAGLAELWVQYTRSKDVGIRNELVLQYSEIVRKIAFKICRAYHVFDHSEELINEGIIALIYSIDKFEPERKIKFETFASHRVHGAMLDFINKKNGYVRRKHDLTKAIYRALEVLRAQLQREPTHAELAQHLEISEEQLALDLCEIQPISMISISQTRVTPDLEEVYLELPASPESDPAVLVDREELCEELATSIAKLNHEQQLVLSLFYQEELTIGEIAEILQMETTRVSQIRFQAIKKLKRLFNSEKECVSI